MLMNVRPTVGATCISYVDPAGKSSRSDRNVRTSSKPVSKYPRTPRRLLRVTRPTARDLRSSSWRSSPPRSSRPRSTAAGSAIAIGFGLQSATVDLVHVRERKRIDDPDRFGKLVRREVVRGEGAQVLEGRR